MAYVCTVVDRARGGWAVYSGLVKQMWPNVVRRWLVNGEGFWRGSAPDDVQVDIQLLADAEEVSTRTFAAFVDACGRLGAERCVNAFIDRLPTADAVAALDADDPVAELSRRLELLGDWRAVALGKPGRAPAVTGPTMIEQLDDRRTAMATRLADQSPEALRREAERRTPCVYEVLIDGRCVYVGSSRRSLLHRLAKHAADDHSPLRPLIREHGLGRFTVALLQECTTWREALAAEYAWSVRRVKDGCTLLNRNFGKYAARPTPCSPPSRGTDVLCVDTGLRCTSTAVAAVEAGVPFDRVRRDVAGEGRTFRRVPAVRVVCTTTGEEFANAVDAAAAHGLTPVEVHRAACVHGQCGGLAWATPPLATAVLAGAGPRPVVCVETGDVFENATACAVALGTSCACVRHALEGQTLAVGRNF